MQYWPNKGSANYGFLTVTMRKEEMFANYVVRTLSVEPSSNQVHYIEVGSGCSQCVGQHFSILEKAVVVSVTSLFLLLILTFRSPATIWSSDYCNLLTINSYGSHYQVFQSNKRQKRYANR